MKKQKNLLLFRRKDIKEADFSKKGIILYKLFYLEDKAFNMVSPISAGE
jgi:hypothetical protein